MAKKKKSKKQEKVEAKTEEQFEVETSETSEASETEPLTKDQLISQFLQVKAEVKAHITLVQLMLGHAQQSRQKLDQLNQFLLTLEQQIKES